MTGIDKGMHSHAHDGVLVSPKTAGNNQLPKTQLKALPLRTSVRRTSPSLTPNG